MNVAMSPPVRVAVTDSLGNPVAGATDTVTLELGTNLTGATLQGTTRVAAVDGIATFADVRLDRLGRDYTLGARAAQIGGVESTPFAVYSPLRLLFVTQPPDSSDANVVLSPAVRVAVTDGSGNPVARADTVTLAFAANPSGARLLGTATVVAVDGIATFADLRVDRPGNGYTLAATAPGRIPATSTPFTVHLTLAAVDAGGGHSCGATTGGAGYCWGDDRLGQLGDGPVLSWYEATPAPVGGGLSFAIISAGGNHTCAVTTSYAAYCWGVNDWSQLGDGGAGGRRNSPDPVTGGLSFTTISAGGSHTCGVTTQGSAYCWGANNRGQVGDGGIVSQRAEPWPVAGPVGVTTVSAGFAHTCAVTSATVAYCWGWNAYGQLGDGTTTSRFVAAPVVGAVGFTTISAGDTHTCGLTTGGTAYCWGSNLSGQLGDGTTTQQSTPVPVAGGLSFTTIRAGGVHTCGVTTSGVAYCWGGNTYGQLGDGTTTPRATPAPVAGGLTFTTIRAGSTHTCGVTTDQVAYCWGSNGAGKLGDGTTTSSLTPARVVQ